MDSISESGNGIGSGSFNAKMNERNMFDLASFTQGAEAFYVISDQMPVSYILALLWVAQNPDGNQLDLEKYLGSSNATTSRAVKYWSKWKSFKKGTHGPDFIESYHDPMDQRYKRLKLTKTGQMFITHLKEKFKWQGSTGMAGKQT